MALDVSAINDKGYDLTGNSKYTQGTRRLCQKFIIELLTERGSMKYLPNRGCSFLPRLRQTLRTEFDIIVAFAAAKEDVKRCLRNDETVDTPMSERYGSAKLNKILISDGCLTMEIAVRSRDGAVVSALTPPISI